MAVSTSNYSLRYYFSSRQGNKQSDANHGIPEAHDYHIFSGRNPTRQIEFVIGIKHGSPAVDLFRGFKDSLLTGLGVVQSGVGTSCLVAYA